MIGHYRTPLSLFRSIVKKLVELCKVTAYSSVYTAPLYIAGFQCHAIQNR